MPCTRQESRCVRGDAGGRTIPSIVLVRGAFPPVVCRTVVTRRDPSHTRSCGTRLPRSIFTGTRTGSRCVPSRAAGSGGVQLVDRADVSEVYVTGEEVLVFENAEELVEIARRVEARPEGFVALREAARRRTLAEHTLTHRAKQLKSLW
ncbi:glycosyltransferase family 1 protein [Dermacoccus abyssi]|uniref:Glycosyltransferase family 1 protein n=1 Tax=Dermacoccus abyssi TaxID=322596 RepID=A0ABX5ZA07_9MICO|nr:glycosyltransferase family 1 protein [Dermacoccus abyssi]